MDYKFTPATVELGIATTQLQREIARLKSAIRQHKLACDNEKKGEGVNLGPQIKTRDELLHEVLDDC